MAQPTLAVAAAPPLESSAGFPGSLWQEAWGAAMARPLAAQADKEMAMGMEQTRMGRQKDLLRLGWSWSSEASG